MNQTEVAEAIGVKQVAISCLSMLMPVPWKLKDGTIIEVIGRDELSELIGERA